MALTDIAIRNAKAGAKAVKLADGGGMFLFVTPAGGKLWRLQVSDRGAREAAGDRCLSGNRAGRGAPAAGGGPRADRAGKDPSREKQRDKVRARIQAADTFAAICTEYCAERRRDGAKGWAPSTAIRSEYLLGPVTASIGKLPIGAIQPADVPTAVRRIEGKGKLESARRSLQLAGAVFRYAVALFREVQAVTGPSG